MSKFKASSWMSPEGYRSGKQAEVSEAEMRAAAADPDMRFAKFCIGVVIVALGGAFVAYGLPEIAASFSRVAANH